MVITLKGENSPILLQNPHNSIVVVEAMTTTCPPSYLESFKVIIRLNSLDGTAEYVSFL